MKNLIIALSLVIGSLTVEAQISQVGAVVAGGSGCVGGNVKTSVTSTNIYVAYPAFQFVPDSRSILARANCSLAIPVSVPQGYRWVASAVTTGLARLQGNDRVKASQEIFTAGSVDTPQVATLTSANKLFSIGRLNSAASSVQTACGQDAILRLNVSAVLQKTAATSLSRLTLTKSVLNYQLVPCQ